MAKRVTIMIDDELYLRARETQARTIIRKGTGYSFSRTVNDQLRKSYDF